MSKKSIFMIVSLVLCLTMAISGTLAYLTDTDTATNVFELGNVDITLNEQQYDENGNLIDYDQTNPKPLFPAIENEDGTPKANHIDKIVTVDNDGRNDAFLRVVVAFEMGTMSETDFRQYVQHDFAQGSDWEQKAETTIEIAGQRYFAVTANYVGNNGVFTPGNTTGAVLNRVWLDKTADNKQMEQLDGDGNGQYNIYVAAQAMQTAGFDSADAALLEGFGLVTMEKHPWTNLAVNDVEEGKDITGDLAEATGKVTYNIGAAAEISTAGQSGGNKIGTEDVEEIVFQGNGANASTLTFTGAGIAAVAAKNPEATLIFKDLTIVDESKSYKEDAWELGYLEFAGKLVFENVTFENAIMLNNDNGNSHVTLASFNNCTFNASVDSEYAVWVGHCEASFENCTFTGTRGIKIHEAYGSEVQKVTVNNCDFTLTKKPGVAIGTVDADTTISITNSKFTTQAGDQCLYIYETDTEVDTFNFHESGNTVDTDHNPATTVWIDSAEKLKAFRDEVNSGKNYSGMTVILTADIDLENEAWEPIGQTGAGSFLGVFDGNGHTISNLTVNNYDDAGNYISSGLFGWIEKHGNDNLVVKNLKIDGATINGHHNVGVIAGYLIGTIENCHVTKATVTCTHANNDACGDKAGVIAGIVADGQSGIKDCTATNSTVTAGRDAGQIVGANTTNADMTNCSASNVTVSAAGGCTGANIRNELVGRTN